MKMLIVFFGQPLAFSSCLVYWKLFFSIYIIIRLHIWKSRFSVFFFIFIFKIFSITHGLVSSMEQIRLYQKKKMMKI